jgi:hypothetical protein
VFHEPKSERTEKKENKKKMKQETKG